MIFMNGTEEIKIKFRFMYMGILLDIDFNNPIEDILKLHDEKIVQICNDIKTGYIESISKIILDIDRKGNESFNLITYDNRYDYRGVGVFNLAGEVIDTKRIIFNDWLIIREMTRTSNDTKGIKEEAITEISMNMEKENSRMSELFIGDKRLKLSKAYELHDIIEIKHDIVGIKLVKEGQYIKIVR